jgi:hypothetical protein
MFITFAQVSKKKRRWAVELVGFPWLTLEVRDRTEKVLFGHNENCRLLIERSHGLWFTMIVEFKNDADEAAFMLWASNGVEV